MALSGTEQVLWRLARGTSAQERSMTFVAPVVEGDRIAPSRVRFRVVTLCLCCRASYGRVSGPGSKLR